MSDIPDWAQKEAVKRLTAAHPLTSGHWRPGFSDWLVDLFAHHIADHEEAPVDPLLIAKRQALGEWADLTWGKSSSFAADYRAGKNDDDSNARLAEIALRRGIEIAGGGNG